MIDREKVIYNLGIISVCCKNRQNIKAYDEIDREMYADWEEIIENTIDLLKEDCHNCKLECLMQKYDQLKEKYDKLLKEQTNEIKELRSMVEFWKEKALHT